ncbi:unnamed protein product [Effrenium voratum]|nr:unnamed protein product [Effrenium voratum]
MAAKHPRIMTLFERFKDSLEARCAEASEEEAPAAVLAREFLAAHGKQAEKVLSRFGADGKLRGESAPASAYNDFYKWTMMPVIRALEKGTGDVRCTFSANIRDSALNAALVESAKQEPPGALWDTLRSGLEELAQRPFDRELFERAAAESQLPGWDAATLEAVCGPPGAARSMAQELDLNPRGARKLPKNPSDVQIQAFLGTDVKTGQERLFVEATGPWHRVTWLETSMMQVIYESFFRLRMRERFGKADEEWYGQWLANAFLRCCRSVLAARASKLKGMVMTGRRTGGLPLILLQGMFIQHTLKDAEGQSLCAGTSSVTAHYWLKDAEVPQELLPPAAGTHAHELSMVSSALLGDVDDKAGVPLSQLVSHILYFLRSRPLGDVQDARRKVLMPILPDTLGSKAFFRTAAQLKVPTGPHKGQGVLEVVGSARQDSGPLEAFASVARSFGFTGGLMASEVEVPQNLLDASALGYSAFGAGGFFGDSEKAWSKDGTNISMAIKVLVVHVNGTRSAVDPVKTGDPSAGGEGKFEADGLMPAERLAALKARTEVMQQAEAKITPEEMQELFEQTVGRFLGG